jgi:trk system potassium uptake protein TrkA
MHILIVGGGRMGCYLADLLTQRGHRTTVIERSLAVLAQLRHEQPSVKIVAGSGTDPDVLEASGIRQIDAVAALTGTDETNLVVASLARYAFHVRRTLARVNDPANAWMFTAEQGVDIILNQADLLARRIADDLV